MSQENQSAAANRSSHTLEIYQKILDNVEEEIMLLDRDFKIIWSNKNFTDRYISDKESTSTGQFCYKLTHKLDHVCRPPYDICPVEEAIKTKAPVTAMHTHFDRKGNKIYAQVSVYPIYENDAVVEFIHISRDITKRVMAEERLQQAQKMEAIGVLAGGIAHDFNNILTVILGYTEMVCADLPPGSRAANGLEQVLSAAKRAKDLTSQILSFSRQSDVERMPMNIQPLIKESLKMLRSSLPSTITLKENIDPHCGVILANPTHIHQIVMNLGTNAYHAMEQNGGLLSVALKLTVIDSHSSEKAGNIPSGEYIEFTVSDTGTGIGVDVIDKIFVPYFTTKGINKGTGMGLSIIHGIINSYGGAITVESTLSQGSMFHVYFPVIQEKAKSAEQPHDTLRGKERILFVDDEIAIMEMERDMLQRLGYTVTAYNRSLTALEEFRNDPHLFDLVITDQTMPVMTGTELSQQILSIRPDMPIILCTGYSNLVDEESAKALGIRGYALKPLTISSLGELIRKVLDEEPTS